MSNLNINSKEFFSNYIFHPRDPSLSDKDSRKAVIASVVIGILSLGIVHLVCLIKYRNVKHILQPTGTTASVNNLRPSGGTAIAVPSFDEAFNAGSVDQQMKAIKLIAQHSPDNFEKCKACRILGTAYMQGMRGWTEVDNDKAIYWLKKGIEAGDLPERTTNHGIYALSCSTWLSDLYIANPNIAPEADELYKLADRHGQSIFSRAELMAMAAGKGNTDAMFEMGMNYYNGNDGAFISKDLNLAIDWLKKAGDNDLGKACAKLANIYLVEVINPQEGGNWLIKAFENGESEVEIIKPHQNGHSTSLELLRTIHNRVEAIDFLREIFNIDMV